MVGKCLIFIDFCKWICKNINGHDYYISGDSIMDEKLRIIRKRNEYVKKPLSLSLFKPLGNPPPSPCSRVHSIYDVTS